MARNASEAGRLVMRKIRNPRQDSPMLLASRRATSGYVTQWIRQQFLPGGILAQIYRDLLHPQGSDIANKESAARKRYQGN